MDRYDEARSCLNLALEKLAASTPTKATTPNFEEAVEALDSLSDLIDAEKPAEDEVETPGPPDPHGTVLVTGVAEVGSYVPHPGDDLFVRVVAPASGSTEPKSTLTIGTLKLERVSNGLRLSSEDGTQWEGDELAKDGRNDFVFRVVLGSDTESGEVQVVVQLVENPVLNMATDGDGTQTATFDAAQSQIEIGCADDLVNVAIGTTLTAVLGDPLTAELLYH